MFCLLLLNSVSYVFLLLMYVLFCIFCFHRANWHSSTTLSEVFPCFFFSDVGKCQGINLKDRARSAIFLISELCCSMYCFMSIVLLCVLCVNVYYCHRVSTQLQLNILYYTTSYHIISYHIIYHISYHIIAYHIIYHVIYHIISYHMLKERYVEILRKFLNKCTDKKYIKFL
jgi:hypothetical protein